MSLKRVVCMLAIILALFVPLSGCGLHGRPAVARKSRSAAPPSGADQITAEVEPDTVVAPGIVEPWGEQVDLAAQESGWIARIAVREGDVVRAGQLLAILDDDVQRRAVDVATADLAEAQAVLARTERGTTSEELLQAQAEVDAASARERQARSAAERAVLLHGGGVIADDALDRATAEIEAQAALAERARARLQELRRGPRSEDRTVARVRVEAARARLELAEENVERRRISAPSDATILLSRFQEGEHYDVGAGALLVLGDMSRLQVRLEVDEIDALAVQVGAPCGLYSDSGERLANGSVVRLAPRMGRRALRLESPTAREDVRVREVFVEAPAASSLVPGQRVWGRVERRANTRSDKESIETAGEHR